LRELSLHILDLVENALKAEATIVAVAIREDPDRDSMSITVDDNGHGSEAPAELVTDPFYTTEKNKRTGLGLSLFRFRVEQAGGRLNLKPSELGGLSVRARLQLAHVDRNPLGDLASTLSSVLATNPGLELRVQLQAAERSLQINSREVVRQQQEKAGGFRANPYALARSVYTKINEGLEALQIKE